MSLFTSRLVSLSVLVQRSALFYLLVQYKNFHLFSRSKAMLFEQLAPSIVDALDSTANINIGCIYPILGCTDNDYVEWNPFADVDDGSCQTLKIFGCVDSTMYNYDPSANTMELIDTCVYTLVLHDLMGNGWVGSHLKLVHPDTTYQFTLRMFHLIV